MKTYIALFDTKNTNGRKDAENIEGSKFTLKGSEVDERNAIPTLEKKIQKKLNMESEDRVHVYKITDFMDEMNSPGTSMEEINMEDYFMSYIYVKGS